MRNTRLVLPRPKSAVRVWSVLACVLCAVNGFCVHAVGLERDITPPLEGGKKLPLAGAQVPPLAFVTQEDAFEEKCDGAFWHVQGIAISDDAVYCGLLKNIVKFDLATGKCIKGVSAPYHTGDVCWHNGRLYASVLSNFEAARKNPSEVRGAIQVYDEDLNLIRTREFPMGFDGIAALDGVLYLGRGAIRDEIGRTCRIVRVKEETLEFIDEVEIEPGFEFRFAVQDIATDGRHLFLSFYPVKGPVGVAVYTKDLRLVKTLPETFSNGFDRLPGRFQRPGAPTLFGVLRSFTRKDAQGLAVPGYSAYLQTFAWDGEVLRDVTPPSALALRDRPSRWLNLFNGKDLSGWTPKIRGYKAGENPGNTFRVVDGCLCNRYDDPMYADGFKQRYGHLFYNRPFSNYVLRATYRMPLPQVKGGEGWANYNNGIMLHGQTPESMGIDQPFPVSIEYQLLSRARKGQSRSTANLCTPGTNVERDGKLYTPHVLNSTSRTCEPDAWTTVEAEVRGGERIIHRLDGRIVLEYEKPQYDPRDGSAKKLIEAAGGDLILRGGTISIQSESAPTDFKSILVRPLPQEPPVALP